MVEMVKISWTICLMKALEVVDEGVGGGAASMTSGEVDGDACLCGPVVNA